MSHVTSRLTGGATASGPGPCAGRLRPGSGAKALLHHLNGSGVLSGLLRNGGDGRQLDARRRVARLPLGME